MGIRTLTCNPAYHYHKIIKVQRGIFASPGYLKQYGTPQTPSDLNSHHAIIYSDVNRSNLWKFNNEQTINIKMSHQCNNAHLLIQMAIQGIGCIRSGRYQVMQHLENGSLVEVLKDYAPEPTDLYLVYPKQDFIAAKTQAFVDFILDYCQLTSDGF